MLLGVALATATIAAPALAQDESLPPDASLEPASCAILTADEVSAALDETVTLMAGSGTNCQFDADYAAGRFMSLFTSLAEDTTTADIVSFLCSGASPDPTSSAAPCGSEVPVGSSVGAYIPDSFGTMLYVDIGDGDLLAIQLVGDPVEGVDRLAALTDIGALALPRVADVPQPVETDEPSASVLPDPDLAALFPTDIAGSPITVQTVRGSSILSSDDADTLQAITDALTAHGKTIDDLSAGFGGTDDGSVQIVALRVQGTDVRPFAQDLIAAFIEGPAPSMTPQGVAAGKDVSSITQDGQQVYVYPKDDVLWLVVADGAALAETFARLP
jgi:hypothetical protein